MTDMDDFKGGYHRRPAQPWIERKGEFTASDARALTNSFINKESLTEILARIKAAAARGKDWIDVSYSLETGTRNELVRLGYRIEDFGGMAIQMEGDHHRIRW